MKLHALKTLREPFEAVMAGTKTHEIRVNDRNFKVGDVLILCEYEENDDRLTGRSVVREVTYISHPGTWGLPPDDACLPGGLCVLSIADPIKTGGRHGRWT